MRSISWDESWGEVQPRISPLDRGAICGMTTLNPARSRTGFRPWSVALNWIVPTVAIVFGGWKFRSRVAMRCEVSIVMSTNIYSVLIFVTSTGIKQLCA